ncbi:NAD(P)/FAD-dependent oxidoreductase [Streptomyces sp. NPDC002889]|uniref:NAD(P)/FAD-dependent oxidoreductase n=1 Tax=Streptomyces sp. NPDC002889 TaxID=3364669 RepID=UPI003693EA38
MASEIVVIGGGTAGTRLARQLGAGARVTVLAEESHAPYNRVLLAEVLAGRYGPEVIALPEVPVRRGVRAASVDRERRLVHCADGTSVPYDRLVLATGSNPVLPPLRGIGPGLPEGVHPFRTMDDCAALSEAVVPGIRAVVVGGGLLGVSAARALASRGARVVLAQQGEHLMERQLDVSASALLRTHLESLGVEVHTECRVRGLRCGDDGAVSAVALADGYALEAEIVVLACGVRPRVGLAVDAGLEVRRGIVVDDELRTSDPRIHAIGDCAEHAGVVHGLAGPALEQADVLASVLKAEAEADTGAAPRRTGAAPRYTGTRALTRLTLTAPVPAVESERHPHSMAGPLDLAAFGDPTPRPGDDVVQLADATRGAYRKVVVRGDRLVGGVLLGDLASVGALARAWEGDEALPDSVPLLHLLTNDGGL